MNKTPGLLAITDGGASSVPAITQSGEVPPPPPSSVLGAPPSATPTSATPPPPPPTTTTSPPPPPTTTTAPPPPPTSIPAPTSAAPTDEIEPSENISNPPTNNARAGLLDAIKGMSVNKLKKRGEGPPKATKAAPPKPMSMQDALKERLARRFE